MSTQQARRLLRLPFDSILPVVNGMLASPHRQVAVLQFGSYAVVGGICFSIDIAGFVILRSVGLPILTASAISFIAATISNYLLCCAFVFRRGRFSRTEELLRLLAIASIGLALNSAVVWLLAGILGLDPTLAKILAVLPILGWNYFARRAIVFGGTPARGLATIAERVRARL